MLRNKHTLEVTHLIFKNMRYVTILLLFTSVSFAQNILHNKQFNFSMQEPEGWIKAEENESLKNIKEQINLSEKKMDELIESNKGTIEIATFYKYDAHLVNGVIPTVKVSFRKHPAKTFKEFQQVIDYTIVKMKKTFPKFTITLPPTKRKLNGKDCIYYESINIVPFKTGEAAVRSFTYAVPVGNRFFQINFMDTKEDDNKKLFDGIVGSIKL